MKLNNKDSEYFKSIGLSPKDIEKQILLLKKGTKYLNLSKPARLKDGIIQLDSSKLDLQEAEYLKLIANKSITKFIPASGAATRMFKDLYSYLEDNTETEFINYFINNINKFAFFDELKKFIKTKGFDISNLLKNKDYSSIIRFLIEDKGMAYGSLPKALLKFHKSKKRILNPIDEHLKEAAAYCGSMPTVLFTISEQFNPLFTANISKSIEELKLKANYKLTYQKEKTNTIAVDLQYKLVKTEENKYLIRPGGHGSLIDNLNEINSDIIFIKNIDNVCSESYFKATVKYKKALVNLLLDIQNEIFIYAKKLKEYDGSDKIFNEELLTFLENKLNIYPKEFSKLDNNEIVNFFSKKINRPIRVCGMVKNEGEPGGGPFWVENKEGDIDLQIVESLQINHKDRNQKLIFSESTHFNPVDIVCATKDNNGEKFDLSKFIDQDAVFVTQKSFKGKEILALEHPGLWNGGMGNWNTIFVEVSSETFNPVKTVNDLLKETHQN